ncbi:MAG: response regulator [Opitutaceae bacterium]|nr:response regulator [Opitutaceae bacterium]
MNFPGLIHAFPASRPSVSAPGLFHAAAYAGAMPHPAEAGTFIHATAPRRILLVDDDADVREVCARLLRRVGYLVEAASDGEAGWTALQGQSFDLLITDICMPRLTGVQLLGRLRTAGSHLPVVLVSGTLPWEAVDAPPELRPVSTISKPFSTIELLTEVRTMLRPVGAGFEWAADGLPHPEGPIAFTAFNGMGDATP